eukprot:6335221-Alexandrium_andersonii.AAC.1
MRVSLSALNGWGSWRRLALCTVVKVCFAPKIKQGMLKFLATPQPSGLLGSAKSGGIGLPTVEGQDL